MRDHLSSEPSRFDYWDTVFDAIPFPIYVVDAATHELIVVNRAMRQRTGGQAGELCYKAIYRKDEPCLFCAVPRLLANAQPIGSSLILEYFNDLDDRWYQLQESLISWFDGRAAKHSVAIDVSELKEAQNALAEAHAELSLKTRELERLVATDDVTGLSNRRRLYDALALETERAGRYQSPVSLLMIDVDRFKLVNDNFGHQVGDRTLRAMAEILCGGVRKLDMAGRWGGEEFMVICPNTTASDAMVLAEKLRGAVETHEFPVIGGITCSFGVAQLRQGEGLEKLFGRADAALYRAKEAGRNRVELDE